MKKLPDKNEWEHVSLFPSQQVISAEQVDIWRVDLSEMRVPLQKAVSVLDAQEQDRATRFHFQPDRERFVKRRFIQRHILATYCGCKAKDIRYRKNEFERPILCNADITFNSSSSGDNFIIAISKIPHIGVDIEIHKPISALDSLIEDHFTEAERAVLNFSELQGKDALFYQYWCRKEAALKAIGTGLLQSPQEIDISTSTLVTVNGILRPYSGWHIYDLRPFEACSGALVTSQIPSKIRLRVKVEPDL